MKKHWIQYHNEPAKSPVTYWVHVEADGRPWFQAETFNPPRPDPIPAKGYFLLCVEWNDVVLEFASFEELDHTIEVLSEKNMPSSSALCAKRTGSKGPNSHWLSRLPPQFKPWEKREPLVKYLMTAKKKFLEEFK